MNRLPTKGTLESVVLGFQFQAEATSITIISVTCDVYLPPITGPSTDPDPSAVLDGDPQIDVSSATNVLQRVVGGVNGVSYVIKCTVLTNSGDTLTLGAVLPVTLNP